MQQVMFGAEHTAGGGRGLGAREGGQTEGALEQDGLDEQRQVAELGGDPTGRDGLDCSQQAFVG
jgi:hypothetical protein